MSRAAAIAMLAFTVLTPVGRQAHAQTASAATVSAPDLIYENARVYTVNAKFELAQAVAIRGDKIVAVGSTAEIRRLAGPQTKVVDLAGKPLLPGFADNHVHLGGPLQPWKYGGMIGELPAWIRGADTIPKVLEAIKGQVATLPKGSWIVGELSREQWPNGTLPGRIDFDKVAPDNPVAIARGPHTLLVNSAALKAARITRETTAEGGEIVHGPDGEPNGKILESARRLIWEVMPPETREGGGGKEASLAEWHKLFTQLVDLGVTSVNIAGVRPADLKLVQEMYDRWGDELPRAVVQVRLWPGYDHHADPEIGVKESIAEVDALPDPKTIFTHPKLKAGAIKMSIDGGLSAPIMWTTKPYENRPGFHGEQRIPDSVFYRVAKRAHERGWQLGIHVMGDGAVVMVVDQLERIYKEVPGKDDTRDYLHHVAVMPPESTMKKMGKLHINVASQPGFLLALGSYADEALSPYDEAHQDPSRSLLNHGVRVSYGSDAGPYGPIAGIYAAVTRRGWNDVVHGAEEAVTVPEAIEMHTLEPAYFNFEEAVRGSIEPGKLADLVVLDTDPMTIDPVRIQDIKIERTIIGGKEIFAR
ncbi:amidohydrolase [Sphingomonas hengshuiensis]|nr:amidohydrolase [Sphingomonas hengshuiensis]